MHRLFDVLFLRFVVHINLCEGVSEISNYKVTCGVLSDLIIGIEKV